MLTLFKINKIILSVITTHVVVFIIFPVPTSNAIGMTSESQLVGKLTSQLSKSNTSPASGGQVLGSNIRIPFFPRGFTYPIAELGNCNSKSACFTYCEDIEHTEICAMVSFSHGKMSAEQLKQTVTLASYIKSGYLANCNSIDSCALLCDEKDAEEECAILADTMKSGSRVLGSQDMSQDPSYNATILDQCSSIVNCNLTNSAAGNANSILESLVASGDIPSGCNSAASCTKYCAGSQSIECNNMYNRVANATGGLNGLYPGRVLSVSETLPIDMPSEEPSPEPEPQPYEPTNYLNCVIGSQTAIPDSTTTPQTTPQANNDAQEFDRFNNAVDRCGAEYSPGEEGVAQYAANGKQQVSNEIETLKNCILGLQSSRDINLCLNINN